MLTERELEVLVLRTRGKSQKAIAKELYISQAAVSQFEKSAKDKFIEAEKTRELLSKEGAKVIETSVGKKVVWGEKK